MVGGHDIQTKQKKEKKWLPLPAQVSFWPNVYMKEWKKFQPFQPG